MNVPRTLSRVVLGVILLVSLATSSGASVFGPDKPLSNYDVERWFATHSRNSLDDNRVVGMIELHAKFGSAYDVSPQAISRLEAARVPPVIIQMMIDVDAHERTGKPLPWDGVGLVKRVIAERSALPDVSVEDRSGALHPLSPIMSSTENVEYAEDSYRRVIIPGKTWSENTIESVGRLVVDARTAIGWVPYLVPMRPTGRRPETMPERPETAAIGDRRAMTENVFEIRVSQDLSPGRYAVVLRPATGYHPAAMQGKPVGNWIWEFVIPDTRGAFGDDTSPRPVRTASRVP